jgi:hypothetical protein
VIPVAIETRATRNAMELRRARADMVLSVE